MEEIGRSIHFYSLSTMCFSIVLFSILNSIQVGGGAARCPCHDDSPSHHLTACLHDEVACRGRRRRAFHAGRVHARALQCGDLVTARRPTARFSSKIPIFLFACCLAFEVSVHACGALFPLPHPLSLPPFASLSALVSPSLSFSPSHTQAGRASFAHFIHAR